jgi:hypothetical protein
MNAESIVVSTVDYDKDELEITWDPFILSAGDDAYGVITDSECQQLCTSLVSSFDIELTGGDAFDRDYSFTSEDDLTVDSEQRVVTIELDSGQLTSTTSFEFTVKFSEYVKSEGYGIYEYDYLLEFDYLIVSAQFTIEIPEEEVVEEEVIEEVVDEVIVQSTDSTEEEVTEDAIPEETEFVEPVIESFLEWTPPVRGRKNR